MLRKEDEDDRDLVGSHVLSSDSLSKPGCLVYSQGERAQLVCNPSYAHFEFKCSGGGASAHQVKQSGLAVWRDVPMFAALGQL
jgi:hypothetical protein